MTVTRSFLTVRAVSKGDGLSLAVLRLPREVGRLPLAVEERTHTAYGRWAKLTQRLLSALKEKQSKNLELSIQCIYEPRVVTNETCPTEPERRAGNRRPQSGIVCAVTDGCPGYFLRTTPAPPISPPSNTASQLSMATTCVFSPEAFSNHGIPLGLSRLGLGTSTALQTNCGQEQEY